ncbi:NmrA family NAD(P)-binding protein [Nesterenkonia sp. E16_7]|uniref:NmrA family NAD(P)-binding protein n=1 Tax=unclassified Nesterenkonia TaxID=2629769 RepID=UPI001A93A201|nr:MULTISPECIES: NmrA family NAD(P)-binding protein [unclassified Nesterenkonia]MBO0594378.1 NmrA family NAD(P)-binding protein [Nesterenkonia sp. E16_10]MBO0598343.1 NmrA family NAD(P)-binding protein [Nesterenkonia sp. E16_7]
MTAEPILVSGATGNVGRAVVERLLQAGVRVRAAGRSVESVQAAFGDRVEAVALDFTDEATWRGAFTGVRGMFLLRPPQLGRPKTQMIPALEHARELGLSQIVFLSLQGAERNPVVPHAEIERWLRASGVSWTFVRASFFHQNLSTTHVSDIRDREEIMVPAGHGRTSFVDAEDVGAVAAAALLSPAEHKNLAWTITGDEALSYTQVAEILTAELGRPVRYSRPGALRYGLHARKRLGMPWGMVCLTIAIYTAARLGRADGISTDLSHVLGRAPRSFAEFAHRHQEVWDPTRQVQ